MTTTSTMPPGGPPPDIELAGYPPGFIRVPVFTRAIHEYRLFLCRGSLMVTAGLLCDLPRHGRDAQIRLQPPGRVTVTPEDAIVPVPSPIFDAALWWLSNARPCLTRQQPHSGGTPALIMQAHDMGRLETYPHYTPASGLLETVRAE